MQIIQQDVELKSEPWIVQTAIQTKWRGVVTSGGVVGLNQRG